MSKKIGKCSTNKIMAGKCPHSPEEPKCKCGKPATVLMPTIDKDHRQMCKKCADNYFEEKEPKCKIYPKTEMLYCKDKDNSNPIACDKCKPLKNSWEEDFRIRKWGYETMGKELEVYIENLLEEQKKSIEKWVEEEEYVINLDSHPNDPSRCFAEGYNQAISEILNKIKQI